MKTKTFTALIERAITEVAPGSQSEFDTVPYQEDSGSTKTCLGIFLNDAVHMAAVAAQAMLIMTKSDEYDAEDLEDFALLMQIFRVAPYMQWTCIYFPGLTADSEFTDEMEGSTNEP